MQAMGFNDLNSATSSTSSDPNYRKRYMQPPRGRRPAAASYNEAFLGKSKHPAPIWRWPAFWALLTGFLIQMLAGVLASLFSLFLLLGATSAARWRSARIRSNRCSRGWSASALLSSAAQL